MSGAGHDQGTCGECQAMIRRGSHRIIDLLGHAGYWAYAQHHEAPPWSQVREAWAQASLALTGDWSPQDSFDEWADARGLDTEDENLAAAFMAGAALAARQLRATAREGEPRGALRALLDEVFDDIEHLIGGNPGYIDRDTLDRYRSDAAAYLAGVPPVACCDLHGRNCEPEEQCCRRCTEGRHLNWTDERGVQRFGHPEGEACAAPERALDEILASAEHKRIIREVLSRRPSRP